MRHCHSWTKDGAARLLLASIALIGMGADALGQSLPLAPGLRSAHARSLVAAQGAALLDTTPMTYDRRATAANYCTLGESPEPARVPTSARSLIVAPSSTGLHGAEAALS